MKTSFLMLLASAGALALNASADDSEPIGSPKALELANSLHKTPAVTMHAPAFATPSGSPKAVEFARSLRRAPLGAPSPDLAHAPRPTLAPKDPRFEQALRANAALRFQVAPLK